MTPISKFNDEETAIQDIIDSPEITATALDHSDEEAPESASKSAKQPFLDDFEDKSERNARIVSKSFSRLIKDISEDEADAIKDGAEIIFQLFNRMSTIGRVLSGLAIAGCIVSPFIPRFLRRYKAEAPQEILDNGY